MTAVRAPWEDKYAFLPFLRIEAYLVLAVIEAVFWTALQIKERYKLSYWDSAIIAAAVELGCHTVYSEDLNHDQSYAGVCVVNPFVSPK